MLSEDQIARIQAIIRDAKIATEKTAAERAAAMEAAKTPPRASSMFGASSGVSTSGIDRAAVKASSDASIAAVLKEHTPAEILEAWKQAQLKGGSDPDAEFKNYFCKKP